MLTGLESRLAHLRRRIPEIGAILRGTLRLALEMEELYLATRKRSETEVRVLEEVALMRARLRRGQRISELQAACVRAKAQSPSIEIPHGSGCFASRLRSCGSLTGLRSMRGGRCAWRLGFSRP